MFSKHKKLLLIIVGLVIVFFAYWYFVLSKKGDETVNVSATGGGLVGSAELDSTSASTTSNLEIDKKFINGILSLNSVNIDVKLFETHAYRALSFPDKPFIVDYEIDAGRGNPFLPIGIDSPIEFEAGPGSGNQVVETRAKASTSTTATSSKASSTPPSNPRPTPSRVQ